eukprot:6188811-Pleurochrysis_carterae.AAC.3
MITVTLTVLVCETLSALGVGVGVRRLHEVRREVGQRVVLPEVAPAARRHERDAFRRRRLRSFGTCATVQEAQGGTAKTTLEHPPQHLSRHLRPRELVIASPQAHVDGSSVCAARLKLRGGRR